MKPKTYATLLAILLTITVSNSYANSERPRKARVEMTDEQKTARVAEIRDRVNEIKAMDKSTLTKSERKALKKELRDMNKEAKAIKGGVYLSVGAIIIIILILILIL
jgi:hypothetical protein